MALPELHPLMTILRARGTLSGVLAFAGAIVVAVALSGCGGDDNSSNAASRTSTWADGMCSALVTWQEHVKAAREKVSNGQLSKATLEEASDTVTDANAKFREDIEALGKPPTPTAKEAKSAVQQLSDDLRKNADKIREALVGVSGASGVTAAVTASAGAVEAMGHDLQDTATQLQSLAKDDAWATAFQSSKSCQKLTR
jgi:hypothetical protein